MTDGDTIAAQHTGRGRMAVMTLQDPDDGGWVVGLRIGPYLFTITPEGAHDLASSLVIEAAWVEAQQGGRPDDA